MYLIANFLNTGYHFTLKKQNILTHQGLQW